MANLINKMTKLAMISIIVGGFLGCGKYKSYNLDGEFVRYNESFSTLQVLRSDSDFIYCASSNGDFVKAVYIYTRTGSSACKNHEVIYYNQFGRGREKILTEYQEKFTNYLNKIDQIEKEYLRENGKQR